MKYRMVGQSSKEEMSARDLRDELLTKERGILSTHSEALLRIEREEKKIDVDKIKLLLTDAASAEGTKKYDDADVEADYSEDELESRYDPYLLLSAI